MNHQSIILAAAALCSSDFPINGTSEQTDPNKRLAPANRAQDHYHARFGLPIPDYHSPSALPAYDGKERTTPIIKGPKKMSRAQRKAKNAKGKR